MSKLRFPKAAGRSFFSCKFYRAAEGGLIFFARAVPAAILCGWKGRSATPEFTLITFPGYYGLCKNVIDNNDLSTLNYTLSILPDNHPSSSFFSWLPLNPLLFRTFHRNYLFDQRRRGSPNEIISSNFDAFSTFYSLFSFFIFWLECQIVFETIRKQYSKNCISCLDLILHGIIEFVRRDFR